MKVVNDLKTNEGCYKSRLCMQRWTGKNKGPF